MLKIEKVGNTMLPTKLECVSVYFLRLIANYILSGFRNISELVILQTHKLYFRFRNILPLRLGWNGGGSGLK